MAKPLRAAGNQRRRGKVQLKLADARPGHLGAYMGFWGYMRGMDEEINVYMCVYIYIYAQVMIADIFRYISGFRV